MQFHRRGFAVGAGHGNDGFRERREKLCGELGEQPTGPIIGQMHCALNRRLRTCNDGDGSGSNSVGDEILAIAAVALQSTKDSAWSEFSMIDCESSYNFDLGIALVSFSKRANTHYSSPYVDFQTKGLTS